MDNASLGPAAALRALTGAGLVRRIEPAGRPGLFELRVGDNHHHIVCRTCDAIADVDCAIGETLRKTPNERGADRHV